jgi:surfeit locus 1 family protein
MMVLLGLGTWQVQRLHWKEDLIERAEARLAAPPTSLEDLVIDRDADFRRARVHGVLLHDRSFTLGIAGYGGEPGGTLVTPLRLNDGRVLLVERGWIPATAFPPHVPPAMQPLGEQEILGVLRWRGDAEPGPFTPQSDTPGRHVYWYDWAAIEDMVGLPSLPVVLVPERDGADTSPPIPPRVAVEYRNEHLSYAVTWFSLAGILVVFYIVMGFRLGGEQA